MWHYKDAKAEFIRRSTAIFDWEKAFSNTSVDEKEAIFDRNILNILNKFILHETIVCNDRDPPGFNDKIRLLMKEKTTAYKYFRQNGNDVYWQHRLKVLQDHLNNSIESSKQKTSKCFWSLLKIYLNNRKIPLIPPLFHSNRLISDFKQ